MLYEVITRDGRGLQDRRRVPPRRPLRKLQRALYRPDPQKLLVACDSLFWSTKPFQDLRSTPKRRTHQIKTVLRDIV